MWPHLPNAKRRKLLQCVLRVLTCLSASFATDSSYRKPTCFSASVSLQPHLVACKRAWLQLTINSSQQDRKRHRTDTTTRQEQTCLSVNIDKKAYLIPTPNRHCEHQSLTGEFGPATLSHWPSCVGSPTTYSLSQMCIQSARSKYVGNVYDRQSV